MRSAIKPTPEPTPKSINARLLAAALAGALSVNADAADKPPPPPSSSYQPPLAAVPMNQIIQRRLYPQLEYLFDKMVAEKDHFTLDGVAALKSNDKFLQGKIAVGLAHVVLNMRTDDPRLPERLRQFRAIADMTIGMDNQTWGIHYYLTALYQLKQAGLLERAVSPATLAALRAKLDWRHFVTQPDFQLIRLPTNYYGVAFSVARLRMLLGWEDDSAGKILLDKMLEHYNTYSGKFGFSDETAGEGRFDRYSILLIAEICERFIETGLTVTPELKALLRKAADVALNIANTSGDGFTFGRSLGPYGETAALEILSVSAYLGVLTPEEKKYAYAYSNRIVARYVDFWYNPAMRSVDMWGQGRRTDAYRAKHRILGENFSLAHQLIFTTAFWNKAGMEGAEPSADLQAWLDRTRPRSSLVRFAQGQYDRALAIYRDRRHIFSLLMVNGGGGQYDNSPYYPLPFATGIVAGTPDSGAEHPQLLPKFRLADGTELIGTSYIKDIRATSEGDQASVSYRQDELARLGGKAPTPDGRIRLETTYTMTPGVIVRTDTYTPTAPIEVTRASLEFASFSDGATALGKKVSFAQGDATSFEVEGLDACTVAPTNGAEPFRSPAGAMRSHVSCATTNFTFARPLTIRWTLKYR
ncbi:hypothetical protein [Burkholderia sp. LMU1-1-1.1]|uniref:hypothetical protein n=1 Tax=Burkholderia sp. LMU1-1-1.1 TaxID=3135266 RepID=UPI00342FEE82